MPFVRHDAIRNARAAAFAEASHEADVSFFASAAASADYSARHSQSFKSQFS